MVHHYYTVYCTGCVVLCCVLCYVVLWVTVVPGLALTNHMYRT